MQCWKRVRSAPFQREALRLAAEAERAREAVAQQERTSDEVARHAADEIERQAAEKGRAEARALRCLEGQRGK
jgi:hypothetical protein